MGFAQAYPDDIPAGSSMFESHGLDPSMWEPQELGTNKIIKQERISVKYKPPV